MRRVRDSEYKRRCVCYICKRQMQAKQLPKHLDECRSLRGHLLKTSRGGGGGKKKNHVNFVQGGLPGSKR